LDQHPLETWRRGYPHGNVPVVVVIVVEHGEYSLADEEGWFSVRKLFCALRHGGADSPDSPQVLFAGIGFSFSAHDCLIRGLLRSSQSARSYKILALPII
jgi:hypothetical protein